jgi:hypothetical protein
VVRADPSFLTVATSSCRTTTTHLLPRTSGIIATTTTPSHATTASLHITMYRFLSLRQHRTTPFPRTDESEDQPAAINDNKDQSTTVNENEDQPLTAAEEEDLRKSLHFESEDELPTTTEEVIMTKNQRKRQKEKERKRRRREERALRHDSRQPSADVIQSQEDDLFADPDETDVSSSSSSTTVKALAAPARPPPKEIFHTDSEEERLSSHAREQSLWPRVPIIPRPPVSFQERYSWPKRERAYPRSIAEVRHSIDNLRKDATINNDTQLLSWISMLEHLPRHAQSLANNERQQMETTLQFLDKLFTSDDDPLPNWPPIHSQQSPQPRPQLLNRLVD